MSGEGPRGPAAGVEEGQDRQNILPLAAVTPGQPKKRRPRKAARPPTLFLAFFLSFRHGLAGYADGSAVPRPSHAGTALAESQSGPRIGPPERCSRDGWFSSSRTNKSRAKKNQDLDSTWRGRWLIGKSSTGNFALALALADKSLPSEVRASPEIAACSQEHVGLPCS
jgi:hypothetical protein